MPSTEKDATATGVKFRVCPKCGRDNRMTLLIDQPCEARVIPSGKGGAE